MKNFFSAIQGKFDAKYHGRYLGNIIEQIAAMRHDVVYPLIKVAPLMHGRWPVSTVQSVDAESLYLSEDHRINDRRADLQITLESKTRTARVLVEIKMHDQFLAGQLEDYVHWVQERGPTIQMIERSLCSQPSPSRRLRIPTCAQIEPTSGTCTCPSLWKLSSRWKPARS